MRSLRDMARPDNVVPPAAIVPVEEAPRLLWRLEAEVFMGQLDAVLLFRAGTVLSH